MIAPSLSLFQKRGMIGRYGVEKLARKARSFRSQHVVYSKAYTDAKTITFPFPPTSDLCSFQSPDVSMSPVHGSIPSQRGLGRDAINELP